MINFSNTELQKIIVHKVGNKSKEEGLRLSNEQVEIKGEFLNDLLLKFFTSPFKTESYYHLFHESDLQLNEVYSFVSNIFANPQNFAEQSEHLAKHLYEKADHPKIKSGEFYVVYFADCMIEDEIADAIGLFKTENKETYLNVEEKGEKLDIEYDTGININKMDKGCIIFNTEKDNGFIASIIDNTNKNNEALYWTDDFLKIKPREDNYYHTQNYLEVCKNFADDVLAEVDNKEQIALKNNAIKYFAQQDSFSKTEFEEKVLKDPQTAQVFNDYKDQYQQEYDITLSDDFDISNNAVKKDKKNFKSVIKLDKNFHIYVHGAAGRITKGFDPERDMNYYQLFYEIEESTK